MYRPLDVFACVNDRYVHSTLECEWHYVEHFVSLNTYFKPHNLLIHKKAACKYLQAA